MGKNLIQQRRGRGTSRFRAPSFNWEGEARLPRKNSALEEGTVTDIIHSSGHSAPLAEVKYGAETALLQAPDGIRVGEKVQMGDGAEVKEGNILSLKDIPEGTPIYNLESKPGDGGRFVRSSGTFARIITKMDAGIVVELPSSKRRTFMPDCRAIIGTIAGGGRTEKPFLKAGTRHFRMKAKNKFYPIVSGISMNAVAHPFGGKGSHTKGRPTQASRNAPPGRKVGSIAPRRTGRTKR
ncbi:TPA: 50S ribosomal protein L2 [Candidatus Woesearchaeota archaeon]|nr:50S ribosomal protein L2 [Candidatus Woesearchaeota archaeon]